MRQLAAFCTPTRTSASQRSLFGDVVVIAFLVAQLLDGVFTYVGITTFGPSIEANPLMTWLILTVGEIPALAGAKTIAIAFGMMLHLTSVHRVVAVLTGLYLAFAVIPWAHLLFF